MHASKILASMALMACASASAVRYRAVEERAAPIEKRAEQTAPWVTVDDEGQPKETFTPSMTVEDGSTRIENGAPHDLTASVFTITSYAKVTTSTGEPPNPTAVKKNGEGAFPRCYNTDGDNAPWCSPASNSTLMTGKTYYVTWDPDYFNKTHDNTTFEVFVRMDWLNHTSGEMEKLRDFDSVPAAWGFSPLHIEKKFIKGHGDHNITLMLFSNVKGSGVKTNTTSLYLNLDSSRPPMNEDPKVPTGHTLSIALPTVFGAIILLLIGGCLWNRKTRHIGLGNVMSRNRHGYTGRKQRRLFGGRKDNGIQLDTRDMAPPAEYRDAPERPRRDSDGLGSLANTPTEPSFQQQGTTGGRNVFRDEVRRQDQERSI